MLRRYVVQLLCVVAVPSLSGERPERNFELPGPWTMGLEANSVFDLESEDEGVFRVL